MIQDRKAETVTKNIGFSDFQIGQMHGLQQEKIEVTQESSRYLKISQDSLT